VVKDRVEFVWCCSLLDEEHEVDACFNEQCWKIESTLDGKYPVLLCLTSKGSTDTRVLVEAINNYNYPQMMNLLIKYHTRLKTPHSSLRS
jgi:hypothetical protein